MIFQKQLDMSKEQVGVTIILFGIFRIVYSRAPTQLELLVREQANVIHALEMNVIKQFSGINMQLERVNARAEALKETLC